MYLPKDIWQFAAKSQNKEHLQDNASQEEDRVKLCMQALVKNLIGLSQPFSKLMPITFSDATCHQNMRNRCVRGWRGFLSLKELLLKKIV